MNPLPTYFRAIGSSGRGRTLLMLVVSCSALWLAFTAQPAAAGTYVMRSCNVPGQTMAPATRWQYRTEGSNTYATDECGKGGGFGLNAGPIPRGTAGNIHLDIPTGGPMRAITMTRMRLWMIARLGGSGPGFNVEWVSGDAYGGGVRTGGLFLPPGGSTLAAPFVSPEIDRRTQSFGVILSCFPASSGGDCVPDSYNPLEIRGAEVTLSEDVPPRGYVGGGSLYAGDSDRGTSTVSYSAIDEESGIATVSALLGGTVVGFQDFSAQCPHADFAACPGGRTTSIAVDTAGVPDGVYPLQLRVTDAAGNVGVLSGGQVRVASTGVAVGPVANGSGATADARMSASFAGRRGSRARVSYKGRLTVRGRLRGRSGTPIGGARVEILEQPALRGSKAIRRVAITRTDGSFKHRVGPRVASRTISVRYRPDLSADKIAVSKRLRLDVKPTASLSVKLRGIRVTYRVRVWARPVPRRGKRVLIQGRAAGGAWTTFATRRTDRKGRLTGRYRLRVRRPGVRLQFRARIPKESGYPFTAATTRPVVRRVR